MGDLEKPMTSVGVVIATRGFGNLVSLPIIGILHEKLGSKNCLIFSAFVRGFSGFLIWALPSFHVLLGAVFLSGVAQAGWDIGRQAYMASATHINTRGRL